MKGSLLQSEAVDLASLTANNEANLRAVLPPNYKALPNISKSCNPGRPAQSRILLLSEFSANMVNYRPTCLQKGLQLNPNSKTM